MRVFLHCTLVGAWVHVMFHGDAANAQGERSVACVCLCACVRACVCASMCMSLGVPSITHNMTGDEHTQPCARA